MKSDQTPPIYPCNYVIKVFGISSLQLEDEVLKIILKHLPDLPKSSINARPSKDGKYTALSITFTAESKSQVDAIYRDLTASPHILMTL